MRRGKENVASASVCWLWSCWKGNSLSYSFSLICKFTCPFFAALITPSSVLLSPLHLHSSSGWMNCCSHACKRPMKIPSSIWPSTWLTLRGSIDFTYRHRLHVPVDTSCTSIDIMYQYVLHVSGDTSCTSVPVDTSCTSWYFIYQ